LLYCKFLTAPPFNFIQVKGDCRRSEEYYSPERYLPTQTTAGPIFSANHSAQAHVRPSNSRQASPLLPPQIPKSKKLFIDACYSRTTPAAPQLVAHAQCRRRPSQPVLPFSFFSASSLTCELCSLYQPWLTSSAKVCACKLPFKPAMEDECQCRAKGEELAHGVGGLGGGDGSAHVYARKKIGKILLKFWEFRICRWGKKKNHAGRIFSAKFGHSAQARATSQFPPTRVRQSATTPNSCSAPSLSPQMSKSKKFFIDTGGTPA
jgi:hypothetical protein